MKKKSSENLSKKLFTQKKERRRKNKHTFGVGGNPRTQGKGQKRRPLKKTRTGGLIYK